MNRSEHLILGHVLPKKAFASPSFNIESGLFVLPAHDASRAFFAPVHYEPNYAYPLLVWLHGPGADERELVRIMPLVSMQNFVAVAPRGFRVPSADGTAQGSAWPQDPDHIHAAEGRVWESIEAAQRKFHVAADRVFLAGFDCGGTMAFRIAMSLPDHISGVVSLGGAFPSGQTPFGQWTRARRLPVLLSVGRDSEKYPPEQVCEDLRLFHAAGISITLRQYPCGQSMDAGMLRDMNRWMMNEITGSQDTFIPADNSTELA